ncbi:MFS transporter [Phytohabitans aurantiacus]|uniref:MFS transporter n=1 Tax=Phytohabitans aurantiacus TaxID=3016789 RepID=A0ABQ5R2N1_9ACTN|nr:MFS transporter [Phytohabitans aurantiacus]GLI01039.1 MFS transporter [Phytohabitans aurantiacus]
MSALHYIFLAQGACFATLVSRIPAMRDRFAIDDLRLGVVLAVVPLIAGVGSLAADRLAPRFCVVRLLRIATPVTCACLAAIGTVYSLAVLLMVLALFGLALGVVDATMNAHGVAVQESAGRAMMSGLHAAYSLGGILGSVAAAAATGVPLAIFFGVVGAVACVGCLAMGTRLKPASRPPTDRSSPDPPGVWRRTAIIGAAMLALFIVDSAVSNWGATYLRAVLSAPEHLAALTYGGFAGAALLGRAIGDGAVERFGGTRVVGGGGLLGAAGLLLVISAGTPATGLAGFAVAGFGLSVIAPQAFVAAARAVPQRPGTAIARVNVCVYAGFVLGAPLIGAISALASLRTAFAGALVLVIALTVAAPQLGSAGPGDPTERPADTDGES